MRGEDPPEVVQGGTSEETLIDSVYKVVMRLPLRPTKQSDFGTYKCVAKNSMGEAEELVTVERK